MIQGVYEGMTVEDFHELMDDLQRETATRQAEIRKKRLSNV